MKSLHTLLSLSPRKSTYPFTFMYFKTSGNMNTEPKTWTLRGIFKHVSCRCWFISPPYSSFLMKLSLHWSYLNKKTVTSIIIKKNPCSFQLWRKHTQALIKKNTTMNKNTENKIHSLLLNVIFLDITWCFLLFYFSPKLFLSPQLLSFSLSLCQTLVSPGGRKANCTFFPSSHFVFLQSFMCGSDFFFSNTVWWKVWKHVDSTCLCFFQTEITHTCFYFGGTSCFKQIYNRYWGSGIKLKQQNLYFHTSLISAANMLSSLKVDRGRCTVALQANGDKNFKKCNVNSKINIWWTVKFTFDSVEFILWSGNFNFRRCNMFLSREIDLIWNNFNLSQNFPFFFFADNFDYVISNFWSFLMFLTFLFYMLTFFPILWHFISEFRLFDS